MPISLQQQATIDKWQKSWVEKCVDLRNLHSKLLNIGGKEVLFCPGGRIPYPSIVYKVLFNDGKLYTIQETILCKMEANHCYDNSLKYCSTHAGKVMGGFALSPDNLWREHFWIKAKSGLIETTVLRTFYYGIVVPFKIMELGLL